MNRTRHWLTTILVLSALLSACGLASDTGAEEAPTSQADTETAAPADEGPILVGATLPLTGTFADTGVFVRDGYQAWVEKINAEGGLLGRQVELRIEDDASDPGRAATLLERLITSDGVDLVLGGYPGSSAAAQMSIAEQNQMAYVSMGGHLQSFEQGFTYSFGAPPLMGQWWYRGFFDYLATLPEDEQPTTAAMITVNNPVGAAVREGTIADLERVGIELVMDELYDLPLAAAEPLITQARASGAELFIANSFFPDGVLAIRAVNALGYQPKAILEGVGTLIPGWEQELGAEGNFVVSGTAIHPGLPFADTEVINQLAEERYGSPEAPIYFMFGATWAQVLAKAVEGAGSLDNTAIRDWLHGNQVETIGGTLTFDERGLPEPYSFAVQVLGGAPELVWPEDVQTQGIVYPIPWDQA